MRFVHTADWHLGRSFHGESLLGAQAAMVDHVVEVARSSDARAVVIAGDVYDRSQPPADAVRLFDEALARLRDVCPVVVIPGNHDSAVRLGFGASLFSRADVHVLADPLACGRAVEIDGTCFYGIPYLEPDLVRAALGCEERSHAAVLGAAMAQVRADIAARSAGARAVVVAHAFVTGAATSDSERDLSVGGASSVAASLFADFDYVALGHLHQAQRVGDNGRYAGSPLAFSFSEARHSKSLAVVDLDAGTTELVEFPVPRALATLRGTLDTLLTDSALAGSEDAWVQATLTDAARPADAMARLRARFPHAVVLGFEPEGASALPDGGYASRLRGLSDEDLVLQFVQDVRGTAATDDEIELLRDALSHERIREAAA